MVLVILFRLLLLPVRATIYKKVGKVQGVAMQMQMSCLEIFILVGSQINFQIRGSSESGSARYNSTTTFCQDRESLSTEPLNSISPILYIHDSRVLICIPSSSQQPEDENKLSPTDSDRGPFFLVSKVMNQNHTD